jgi:DNA polymerase-4
MNFIWILRMDRFHGCYQWTNELSQSITKETGLPLSFALSVNKTVSKWNRRIKTNRKIRNSRNHGENFFEPVIHQKNSMVGDVSIIVAHWNSHH